jgi:hypothetical protein
MPAVVVARCCQSNGHTASCSSKLSKCLVYRFGGFELLEPDAAARAPETMSLRDHGEFVAEFAHLWFAQGTAPLEAGTASD